MRKTRFTCIAKCERSYCCTKSIKIQVSAAPLIWFFRRIPELCTVTASFQSTFHRSILNFSADMSMMTLHNFASNIINPSTPSLLFLGRQILAMFRAYCVWKALKGSSYGKWECQGDQELQKRHDQAHFSGESFVSGGLLLVECELDNPSILFNVICVFHCFSICWADCSAELAALQFKL